MEKNIYGLCGKKNVYEVRREYTAKKEMWVAGVEVPTKWGKNRPDVGKKCKR